MPGKRVIAGHCQAMDHSYWLDVALSVAAFAVQTAVPSPARTPGMELQIVF